MNPSGPLLPARRRNHRISSKSTTRFERSWRSGPLEQPDCCGFPMGDRQRIPIAPTSQRLRNRAPDLLLGEVAGSENETCALVQSIRQGTLADNPFMVIIVTTWRRDGTIVGQVLNSGADDLVARPVSTTSLGERIRLLVERRKGFVVTMDYI